MKKYVTVIDIGTTKIVAFAGEKDERGNVNLLGYGAEETPQNSVRRGSIINIESVSKAIRMAVDKAEAMSGVKFNSAYVGIAGQHIKSYTTNHNVMISSNDYEVREEDMNKLLTDIQNITPEHGEDILHVIPQNFTVDKETGIQNPVGMFGKRLEGNFHIIACETASAKNIARAVNRIGIDVNSLYLEPIASAEAVLTSEEKEAGVALIDIGGGTTDIAIFIDNVLHYSAVIPLGGQSITQDIKNGCNILMKQAETLKIEHGSAMLTGVDPDAFAIVSGISGRDPKKIPMSLIAFIINSRMLDIINLIKFHLKNSNYIKKLGAGVALTGGGSLLRNVDGLISYETGLDVRLANPTAKMQNSNEVLTMPQYSTALGLLKLGFDNYEISTNPSETFENIKTAEARRLAKEAADAAEAAAIQKRKEDDERERELSAKREEIEEERKRMIAAEQERLKQLEAEKEIARLAALEAKRTEDELTKKLAEEKAIREAQVEADRINAEEEARKKPGFSKFWERLRENVAILNNPDEEKKFE